MKEIRGTENWYPVTAQELKAKNWALKMGASVINRCSFPSWKGIDVLMYNKKFYVDYSHRITLFAFSKDADDWIPIEEM